MPDKTILGTAHKEAIRQARLGKTHSEATKAKMREAWRKRKQRTQKTTGASLTDPARPKST